MMTVPTRLGLCLLGYLHWAFGNIYELVVLAPNTLFAPDQAAALALTQRLFRVSLPYYYYLPWNVLTVGFTLATAWQVRRDWQHRPADLASTQRWLTYGALAALAAVLATAYKITAFNLVLYVGDNLGIPAGLNALLWRNEAVSGGRILVVAGAAVFHFHAWRASERPAAYGQRA